MHGQIDILLAILLSILISKAMAKAKEFDVLGIVSSSCFVKLYLLFIFLKYVYNIAYLKLLIMITYKYEVPGLL